MNDTQAVTQSAAEHLTDEERRNIDVFIETHVKILSAAYDKAVAYTNLVIVAGYAGLFALWHLTNEHLSKKQALWSALFLLISLTVFVLFEVYKAFYTGTMLRGYVDIVNDPKNQSSLAKMIAEIDTYKIKDQKRGLRFVRGWLIAFMVTTVTGVASAVILLYALVKSLLMT